MIKTVSYMHPVMYWVLMLALFTAGLVNSHQLAGGDTKAGFYLVIDFILIMNLASEFTTRKPSTREDAE